MSMKDLVVSISIRQKDPHDAMSESQEKLARKVYKKRINSWQDYFVKVNMLLFTYIFMYLIISIRLKKNNVISIAVVFS
jgi:hypothetical protein